MMKSAACLESINAALERAETAHIAAMAIGDDALIAHTESIVLELLVKKNVIEKYPNANPEKLCSDMDDVFIRLVHAEEAKKILTRTINDIFKDNFGKTSNE